jgi:hypothetical protein
MASTYRLTLTSERILDGDYFGLRQRLSAQEPAGAVTDGGLFVFDCVSGTQDSYRGVATLAQVTEVNPSYRPYNPCDYVVFDSPHGVTAATGLTLRFARQSSSLNPLPTSWVSLADLQAGTPEPTVTCTFTVVNGTTLQASAPFWTPQARVYCRVIDTDGDVLSEQLVTVRRRITTAGIYRADRFYQKFDSVSDAVNAAVLAQTEAQVLVSALVKDGKAYMQGTNPESVTVVG